MALFRIFLAPRLREIWKIVKSIKDLVKKINKNLSLFIFVLNDVARFRLTYGNKIKILLIKNKANIQKNENFFFKFQMKSLQRRQILTHPDF